MFCFRNKNKKSTALSDSYGRVPLYRGDGLERLPIHGKQTCQPFTKHLVLKCHEVTVFRRYSDKRWFSVDRPTFRVYLAPPMTVCIAASCEDGKHIVVAADQMFTVGPPLNVEFEPPISKIEAMGQTCVAMGAGNGLYVSDIFKEAKEAFKNTAGADVAQIANFVKEAYSRLRDLRIEEQLVKPLLGPDFTAFRARNGTLPQYLQAQPGIYQQLVVQSNQFTLGVELIVAGIDNTGSHVYYVGHPGSMICFDKIGYNAVGSGASHVAIKFALDCLHPKTKLEDVLLAVYSAKRAAEVAPGVGQETEIKVISSKDVWALPDSFISVLKESHAEATKKSKPNAEKIKAKYAELRQNA
jgi:hypothetical protein